MKPNATCFAENLSFRLAIHRALLNMVRSQILNLQTTVSWYEFLYMFPIPLKRHCCAMIEIAIEEFVDNPQHWIPFNRLRLFRRLHQCTELLIASFLLHPRLWRFPLIATYQTLRSARNQGSGCRAIFEPTSSMKYNWQAEGDSSTRGDAGYGRLLEYYGKG